MYIIVAGRPNGEVTYFGAFTTVDRAMEYGKALDELGPYKWHVQTLVVPNCVRVRFEARD